MNLSGDAEPESSILSKTLVDRIVNESRKAGKLCGDKEEIFSLALKDPVTLESRGTDDVFTKYGNPAFITKITSRSAAFTEIFFADPDPRQQEIMRRATEYILSSGSELLYMDKQMGMHPEHRHLCRSIVTRDYARLLLMWDKLIFNPAEDLSGLQPEQVLVMVPEWADIAREFGLQERAILVDAENRVTFVLGSDYFGEVKKGHLRMSMYFEKKKLKEGTGGGLGVHAGGKLIRAFHYPSGSLKDNGALFFGLSGTGKTTLSVHHFWLDEAKGETVVIRQDDFFVLSPDAKAFGTEDNAYIKTEGLEPEGQPLLYNGAISPHSVLENVYVDPETKDIDFFRYDHPFVPGGKCYNGRGIVVRRELDFTDDSIDLDDVSFIFFITRRETIVPPVARLTPELAAAFFMLGESILTSAADPVRAGESVREVGTNPFIVGSKGEEGNIFYDILKRNPSMQCFLLNTGGFGGRSQDVEGWSLDSAEALKRIEDYIAGRKHEDIGKKVEVALRDGTKTRLKISAVRYELELEGVRKRSASDIEETIGRVESGELKGSDVKLVEVAMLAGEKIRIQDSAAIIREIARSRVEWRKDPYWGYDIASEIPGIDLNRFDPERYYSPEEIDRMNGELKRERIEWLKSFDDLNPAIVNAIGE